MPLILALLALLALSACAAPRGAWSVSGGTPEEQSQALALVDAACDVLPDVEGYLSGGGTVFLRPDLTGECFVKPPAIATGCVGGGVWVLWPHPGCPPGADLTCSALPHELAHLGLASGGQFASESQADAGALLVVQQYRRMQP